MAKSPSHKFGQIIGDMLEACIEPFLKQFAEKYHLYLDKKGPRPARTGSKVTWTDSYGNQHDLDFVFEKDGSTKKMGMPVAFIETAWRRYTKHSRNKAQELQGAILPLIGTHRNAAPFYGAVLAGIFTDGALTQLKSLGFKILYFPYQTVVKAFSRVKIDASFEEDTSDAEFAKKVALWKKLSKQKQKLVACSLAEINKREVDGFLEALERSITRQIKIIRVLPLHGIAVDWKSIEEAINFIEGYNEKGVANPISRYEVQIHYSNGDKIEAQFNEKDSAIEFLETFQSPPLKPA